MLDEIVLTVIAGRGGNGAVGFRREKYVPRGGPDGGDGGRGGDVIIKTDAGEGTLDGLANKKTIRAQDGGAGAGGKKHGRDGEEAVVNVPPGTVVWLEDNAGAELADLRVVGVAVVVARGGSGGKGNARFARPERRAPRIAERGLEGEKLRIRLELRLLAEAGLVGLPNAGKSSLLRAVSEARPKIGAYPFTTLEPYLGVVEQNYDRVVLADIPGLIEGAHEGAGLGIKFLRHIQRTLVLVHVVDVSGPDPFADVGIVRGELEAFGEGLSEKRWLVALNKIDLPGASDRAAEVARRLVEDGVQAYAISAQTGEGMGALVRAIFQMVNEERQVVRAEPPPVVRPKAEARVEVVRAGEGFVVRGAAPLRAVALLGTESEEGRVELARRLQRMGVHAALRRAGVKPDDRIRIGEVVLQWPL